MTLTAAAQKILAGAQSGVLENIDEPLRDLNVLLTRNFAHDDLSSAMKIIEEARKAAYAHRKRISVNLQQLERSAFYGSPSLNSSASWQFSG